MKNPLLILGLIAASSALLGAQESRSAMADVVRRMQSAPHFVHDALQGAESWSYALTAPEAGWTTVEFDDSKWAIGDGGFGDDSRPNAPRGTAWTTAEIWLRKSFRVDERPRDLAMTLQHDEDAEVYLNGKMIVARTGYRTSYEEIDVSSAAQDLRIGKNVLAVRCRQTAGGQFIDVGLAARLPLTNDEFVLAKIWRDWLMQDGCTIGQDVFREKTRAVDLALIAHVQTELADAPKSADTLDADGRRALYLSLCEKRRAKRLAPLAAVGGSFVFTRHHSLSGSFYGYTEGLSDAQAECNFRPDSELLRFTLDGNYGTTELLLRDPRGLIRDPELSFDAQRLLFAWKKSLKEDDYHLYEMNLATKDVRQITSGLGFADFEGRYLPDGDIVFSSSRGISTIPCWVTEASNMWRCDRDGNFMRRLGYDQVTTNNPSLLDDGRIVYTRWDYNDRGQTFPQPLFVMNQDGTEQMEFYGGNSWFPTTIGHAREIPGRNGVLLAVLHGHHTYQHGKLAIVDRRKGTQEGDGIEMVAPRRPTIVVREDAYGQDGEQFQYPYPIDQERFLVTYDPIGGPGPEGPWGIYLMDMDGRRELLTIDPLITSNHPILFAPRRPPRLQPQKIDLKEDTAEVILHDIYRGPGLAGVARGTVKKLRVVEMRLRAAEMGFTNSHGELSGARVSTPPAVGNGSWDVKVILGDIPIEDDGSARFIVPARRPIYFQPLDADNQAVQTMRTWATLMPGERLSCVGCHDGKNEAPPAGEVLAMKKPARPLEDFYGPPRGFSFPKEIQPILDKKCVSCHDGEKSLDLTAVPRAANAPQRAWSRSYWNLLGAEERDYGSIEADPDGKFVKWLGSQSQPTLQPPYLRGSFDSPLVALLRGGHQGVVMTREEMDKIVAWIDLYVPYSGDFTEGQMWSDADKKKYAHFQAKRNFMREFERLNRQAIVAKETGVVVDLPRDIETEYDDWITRYAPESRARFERELEAHAARLRALRPSTPPTRNEGN